MNQPDTFDPALLKSLFARLVQACGKQDAAAARLGISRQRVSQLCSANEENARDIPTWDQVYTLERACGRSLVFSALAEQVEPILSRTAADPMKETHDVVQAAAAMLPLAAGLDPSDPKTVAAFRAGLDRLQHEAWEAEAAAANVTPIRKGA